MRVVTVGAIAGRARMLDLCFLDQFGFVGMATNAQIFHIFLGQDHLSIFSRSVACIAALLGKRRMDKPRHQLWRRRLVRIMATGAVRGSEGLILMRFLQRCILDIVTVHAQCWDCLGQMEVVLLCEIGAGLVGYMAGVTTHV